MDTVDRVWQELKGCANIFGGTPPTRKLPLAEFQLSRGKTCKVTQLKLIKKQHAFMKSSALIPSAAQSAQLTRNDVQTDSLLPENTCEEKPMHAVESWTALFSEVQRQVNTLKEVSSNARRFKSLTLLWQRFTKDTVPICFYDRAFPLLLEPLLLCLSDPTEASRQLAADLVHRFLSRVSEVEAVFGQVLEALVPRFGSQDVDGVAHLPTVMRPEPEYKPLQLVPVEHSEDVRQRLQGVLNTLLNRCSDEVVWSQLDMVTGLLRASAMDICPVIKTFALNTMAEFCSRHQNMILHFTEPLARSLLSCLVHQHARIRMRALRTLTHVLGCGLYKYNGEVIQMLAGWRDPNFVPIKSLYETTTVRNYFAEMLADHSAMVRMYFFDVLASWLINFEDKADYETWLFPYLLSGLFDPFRPIQQVVFRLLEVVGKHYEGTHEKDLREIKQLGALEPWNYGGKSSLTFPLGGIWRTPEETTLQDGEQFLSFVRSYSERVVTLGLQDCSLSVAENGKLLVEPLVGEPSRPCLGARTMVKTYFRRYANTLFATVEDFKEVTTTASARLLVVSLAYVEDSFVEWLDDCLRICCRIFSRAQTYSAAALEAYQVVLRLIGIFVDPKIYWEIVKDGLSVSCGEYAQTRVTVLELLALMLEGSFNALHQASDKNLCLGRLADVVPEICEFLALSDLLQEEYVGSSAGSVTKVVGVLLSGILQQHAHISPITMRHLLSIIGSLVRPESALSDDSLVTLEPPLQKLISMLEACYEAQKGCSTAPAGISSVCSYARLSLSLPPVNLAALKSFLQWTPPLYLLDDEPLNVAITKLEEFSLATQKTTTRRGARRAALWLVRRLMCIQPAERLQSGECASDTQTNQKDSELRGQNEDGSRDGVFGKSYKAQTRAAAQILSRIIVNSIRGLENIEDLEDTLSALGEFLTLPQPTANETCHTTQDTLVMSGLIDGLSWLLKETSLNTRLFCTSCQKYAHTCAATYPDKSPAMILEDMPLSKRRELRLAANKAAAELKNRAILLLRISLIYVSRCYRSIAGLMSSSLAALKSPEEDEEKSVVSVKNITDKPRPERVVVDDKNASDMQKEEPWDDEISSSSQSTEKKTADDFCRFQISLPFQTQSYWFLFQVAGCLIDAIEKGSNHKSGASHEAQTSRFPQKYNGCLFPPLAMPVTWKSPNFSDSELQIAQANLLKLLSDQDLYHVVDRCVKHLVELQGAVPEGPQTLGENSEQDPWLRRDATGSLSEVLDIAYRQSKSVSAGRQKDQARLALTQLISLIGKIFPSAVQQCLQYYETTGRFSRHAALSRIAEGQKSSLF